MLRIFHISLLEASLARRAPCGTRSFSAGAWLAQHSDPLLILFCGSDYFSKRSLIALHRESKNNPELIKSIDVLVRTAKSQGRGGKDYPKSLVQQAAEIQGLNVHVRDTFTGWELPTPHGEPINLIVAVSFGLLVPERLTSAAKYGGLNVHPSLLPDLRGPAPIGLTLLAGRSHTGVTLQTLAPEFDTGRILAQDPQTAPGFEILPEHRTHYLRLRQNLCKRAANLLVRSLREGLHVPGAKLPEIYAPQVPHLIHARKLYTADDEVPWVSRNGKIGHWITHSQADKKILSFADPEWFDRPAWSANDATRHYYSLYKRLWSHVLGDNRVERIRLSGLSVVSPIDGPKEIQQYHEKATKGTGTLIFDHIPVANIMAPKARHNKSLTYADDDAAFHRFRGLRTLTFVQQSEPGANHQTLGERCFRVRVPYWINPDDNSIILAMAGSTYLRVKSLTISGREPMFAARVVNKLLNEQEYLDKLIDEQEAASDAREA